ncbi:MAG: hypothetical protein R2939_07300 [Kofleriaceae bacterium]
MSVRNDLAAQQLDDDERLAARGDAAAEDRRDVAVADHALDLGLALEPGRLLGIAGHRRPQDLDRDLGPARAIGGPVDLGHGAAAEALLEQVAPGEHLADSIDLAVGLGHHRHHTPAEVGPSRGPGPAPGGRP